MDIAQVLEIVRKRAAECEAAVTRLQNDANANRGAALVLRQLLVTLQQPPVDAKPTPADSEPNAG